MFVSHSTFWSPSSELIGHVIFSPFCAMQSSPNFTTSQVRRTSTRSFQVLEISRKLAKIFPCSPIGGQNFPCPLGKGPLWLFGLPSIFSHLIGLLSIWGQGTRVRSHCGMDVLQILDLGRFVSEWTAWMEMPASLAHVGLYWWWNSSRDSLEWISYAFLLSDWRSCGSTQSWGRFLVLTASTWNRERKLLNVWLMPRNRNLQIQLYFSSFKEGWRDWR